MGRNLALAGKSPPRGLNIPETLWLIDGDTGPVVVLGRFVGVSRQGDLRNREGYTGLGFG